MRQPSSDSLLIGAIGAITGIVLLQLFVISHRITTIENRIDEDFETEASGISVGLAPILPKPRVMRRVLPLESMQDPPPNEFPAKPRMVYPELARLRSIGGYVIIQYTLEPDGSVSDLKVVSEAPKGYGFAASALQALGKSRFPPFLVNGFPVPRRTIFRVTFSPT